MFNRVHWVIHDDGTSKLYDDGEYTGICLIYYKVDQVEYVKVMENNLVIYDKEGGSEVSNSFIQSYSSNKIRIICDDCSSLNIMNELLYIETEEVTFSLLCNGYHSGIELKNIVPLPEWQISYRWEKIEMTPAFEIAYKRGKLLFAEKYLIEERNLRA
jgi:hypothetical protein